MDLEDPVRRRVESRCQNFFELTSTLTNDRKDKLVLKAWCSRSSILSTSKCGCMEHALHSIKDKLPVGYVLIELEHELYGF